MRLWSLHPKYLDAKGLVALWREGLLAQAVLRGQTAGYLYHPQLTRFREDKAPRTTVARYLHFVVDEAVERGYQFDRSKLGTRRGSHRLDVTGGQLMLEWMHLLGKLRIRAPEQHARLRGIIRPEPHPLFRVVPGDIAPWERATHPRLRQTRR